MKYQMSRQGWNKAPQALISPEKCKELCPLLDIEGANVINGKTYMQNCIDLFQIFSLGSGWPVDSWRRTHRPLFADTGNCQWSQKTWRPPVSASGSNQTGAEGRWILGCHHSPRNNQCQESGQCRWVLGKGGREAVRDGPAPGCHPASVSGYQISSRSPGAQEGDSSLETS